MYRFLMSASCLAIAAIHPAFAQETEKDAQQQARTLDTVIVTGTRAAERTAFETLAPVDVVTGDTLRQTVSPELVDSLAQLIPSFNVQRLPMADGAIFVRPARLRSLSPDQTLVLINGKRRHRSAFLGNRGAQAVDLAQIPSFAISRMEVLRDGASAQYGSDAIAGVINIILDSEPGYSGFGQVSQYYEGDGTQYQGGAKAGFDLGGRGSAVFTAEYTDASATSRSRQRPDAIAFQAANPELNVANPVQRWGKPDREALRLAMNAVYDFTPSIEGYAFGTWGEGSGVNDFNWRNPDSTNAYNTTPLDPDYDLSAIYPAGFTPRFGQDDNDRALTAGVRGDLGAAFNWDLSASYGRNEIDYFINETINASLGSASPTDFRAGILRQRDFNLNADFVYLLDAGLAEPLNIAFGAERRDERFEIEAGDLASYAVGPLAVVGLPSGSNGFPGYSELQAGTFEQESHAAYVDIEAALTDRLTLGGAVRFEDYSEFGSTTDYKLSGRFELTDNLALRSTWSTGFRAPTPGQLESERTSQGLNSVTLNLVTSGRFNPTGPVADIINGRPDGQVIFALTPETSENLSLGLAYRNDLGFTATVDVYQIELDDRFSTRGGFQLTDAERAQLSALGIPGGESITTASFFQNVFDTRTRGVDFVGSWAGEAFDGNLNLSLAYNWNETKVTREAIAGVFNDVSRRLFEEGLPQHNIVASMDYKRGRWGLLSRARYYGEWTDVDDSADVTFQDFSGITLFDLALSYEVNDQVQVRVGAENVFNTYPDESRHQANRGLKYSRNAPYDTDGGKAYIRVMASF
ncbi:MAG: TonB-dependent receptor [Alphaproteobacteria bacterium HGW-Alphaproteobacteria-18]|nr:MAG: TonB-dependent receptor [Alphaproteobacteria bacterium HGW-Alphaproteobacteria-18]